MESNAGRLDPLAPLPCMNCKTPVKHDAAKLFQGVFVCGGCHEIATRAFTRLERELKMMLTLASETIRLALIEGRLQLGPAESGDIPKSELMRSLIELAEKRQKKDVKEVPP